MSKPSNQEKKDNVIMIIAFAIAIVVGILTGINWEGMFFVIVIVLLISVILEEFIKKITKKG